MIAFLDCEASSLSDESYPIEIGWAVDDGRPPESHLIIPHPDWTDWDPAAQAVHGISRRQLFEEGKPGPWVARRMLEVLRGHQVYSDAPEDRRWTRKLLLACGLEDDFRIHDARALIEIEAVKRNKDINGIRNHVTRRFPNRHRAAEDAAYLRALWRAAQRG